MCQLFHNIPKYTYTDIPTLEFVSVEQVSQSMVRVNLSVSDTQCVGSYRVDATNSSGDVSFKSSTNSIVDVTDLNVCESKYTLTGSVLSPGGVQSAMSSPVSFTANLSGRFN